MQKASKTFLYTVAKVALFMLYLLPLAHRQQVIAYWDSQMGINGKVPVLGRAEPCLPSFSLVFPSELWTGEFISIDSHCMPRGCNMFSLQGKN